MLSPISVSTVRVEDRNRRDPSRQRPQKRRKPKEAANPHEENRGDKLDLTA